jgi:hypothetical protein
MILNTITILALFVAIIFLIILIVKPVENFSFFVFDAKLKQLVDIKNKENRNLNIQKNLVENDVKQRKTIDQIGEEVDKFENILTFIKENINNIPVCREIDLRPDLKPTCSNRPLSTCNLNSFCTIKNNLCVNRELNPECADILEIENGKRTGKATKMFVYPTVLEEIK